MSGSEHDGSRVEVALIGCGDVAQRYAATLERHRSVALRGAFDRHPERAQSLVDRHGGTAYPSLEAVLDDPEVGLVVVLTRQASHAELVTRCLEAGKHVYTEKPLALDKTQARALVQLARRLTRRLGCAPITYLGEAQQTVLRLIRSGAIGCVRVAYAELNWGKIEDWHPRPAEFYDVGAAFDVGVYPVTLLTAFLGPARRVRAFGARLLPKRSMLDGTTFEIGAPDLTVALIELASGAVARLTATFYVEQVSKQRGLEMHGDNGSIYLSDLLRFDAAVELSCDAGDYRPIRLDAPPFEGTDYARGPAEMADALFEGREHLASGEHAAHVVEVLEAIGESSASGRAIPITSSFAPLAWPTEAVRA